MDGAFSESQTSADLLRKLYAFMAPREFVASRNELVAAGFSLSRIKNWLRTGRLVAVARGIYSYARDVDSIQRVYRVALLAAGPGSVLAGKTACAHLGLVREPRPIPRLVEVAVAEGKSRSLEGCSPALKYTKFKVLKRSFEPSEVQRRDGLLTVSPLLALLDLAATSAERDARFAFLEACRLKLFGRSDVDECFGRLVGRRGVAKLRPLMALWVPELERIRSVYEGRFLLVWLDRRHPLPKVNERVGGYEVDFHWPDQRVVLEVDGVSFHSDPAQRRIDAMKQKDLERQGWTVLRLSSTQFDADEAGSVDRVAAALRLRAETRLGCAIRT